MLSDWTWDIDSESVITNISGRFSDILSLASSYFFGKKINHLISSDKMTKVDFSGFSISPSEILPST
ncbi:MAG: hypothetical protein QGG84_02940 [Rhodospirillales bacterium]|jgi:hypothetical protein|nr:hypothetical protein [Rhodospirillales bacterium]